MHAGGAIDLYLDIIEYEHLLTADHHDKDDVRMIDLREVLHVRCAWSWAGGGNVTSSAWAAGRPRCQPSLANLSKPWQSCTARLTGCQLAGLADPSWLLYSNYATIHLGAAEASVCLLVAPFHCCRLPTSRSIGTEFCYRLGDGRDGARSAPIALCAARVAQASRSLRRT